MLSAKFIRWGGLAALVGGVIGILYFPFHATAYFATQDGASSLDAPRVAAWAEPFARVFDPLLTFAPPGQVYITFGKFAILVVLGYLAGVLALHSRQEFEVGFTADSSASASMQVGIVGRQHRGEPEKGKQAAPASMEAGVEVDRVW